MRKLKFAATLLLGITIGEFLTAYRLEKDPVDLKTYSKEWFKVQRALYMEAHKAGENLATDPRNARRDFEPLIFPNRRK